MYEQESAIVEAIASGDPVGASALLAYITAGGYRKLITYHLHTDDDVDDILHSTFISSLCQIQVGRLTEPARLGGYLKTIVYRHIVHMIQQRCDARKVPAMIRAGNKCRNRHDLESDLILAERRAFVNSLVSQLNLRDREIITRFYFQEESRETICQAMSLSDTQFRLFKSRGLSKLARLYKRTGVDQPSRQPAMSAAAETTLACASLISTPGSAAPPRLARTRSRQPGSN